MPPTQFKSSEIAQLAVNGINYREWETVWAQERWNESFSFFRFTTAERKPIPLSAAITLADIQAGIFGTQPIPDIPVYVCDKLVLTLGGSPAIAGYVTQRQVAYDKERHQVLLIGKSATFWPFKSHIKTEQAKMDGFDIMKVANTLIGPLGVTVRAVGAPDSRPFDKLQAPPGGNIWEFLEKLARQRSAILGSNAAGEALLIFDHTWGSAVDTLAEGVNIKKMQAVISIEDQWGDIEVLGQTSGDDQKNGPDANEMVAHASGQSCIAANCVIPVEEPVRGQDELQTRADFEAKWTDGTKKTALITVYGWFSAYGLWHAGQNVAVYSPSVPLNEVMKIKTCTWTQDSENGTETVLECVNPAALNDDTQINVGNPLSTADVPPQAKPKQATVSLADVRAAITGTSSDIQALQALAPHNLPETPIPPP
jgi:prophage tail gpP-like protein